VLLNNSRNAMSVTGVVNLTVERSLLALTGDVSGTCCKGGVDMEPETPYRHISNVTFREVSSAVAIRSALAHGWLTHGDAVMRDLQVTFQENGMTQVVVSVNTIYWHVAIAAPHTTVLMLANARALPRAAEPRGTGQQHG
jgi:hypothetical protein